MNQIARIIVRQIFAQGAVGEMRDYEQEPAHLEFPNLTITLAESHAESGYGWHDNFVIKGNNGADKERTGLVTLSSPNLKLELARIDLAGMGIFKITRDKIESNNGNIRRVTAELYV